MQTNYQEKMRHVITYDKPTLKRYVRDRLKYSLEHFYRYDPPLDPRIDEQPEDFIVDLSKADFADDAFKQRLKSVVAQLIKECRPRRVHLPPNNPEYFARLLYLCDILQAEESLIDILGLASLGSCKGVKGRTRDLHNDLLRTINGIGPKVELRGFFQDQLEDKRYFGIAFNMLLAYREIDTAMDALPKMFEIESAKPNLLHSRFLISRLLAACEAQGRSQIQTLKRIANVMSETPDEYKRKLVQIIVELMPNLLVHKEDFLSE